MSPKRYTKKPITIEAMELNADTFYSALDWVGVENYTTYDPRFCEIGIGTLEGEMTATSGDFIIKGVKGEFYPCKPDIFHISYNEATP